MADVKRGCGKGESRYEVCAPAFHSPGLETGVATGLYGTILWTNDGGITWDKQESNTDGHLWGVDLWNESTGAVVGYDGTILWTTDGGATWERRESGTNKNLFGISLSDAYTATAVGGAILRTTDGVLDLRLLLPSFHNPRLLHPCVPDLLAVAFWCP